MLFHHTYIDNQTEKTLFLLHGTGGDENDVLPLVQPWESKYNFVGLRGNISEHGMNRFFKRKSEGVFDQDSITEETTKLAKFIQNWMEEKSLSADQLAFLGYSNGANMILATLFKYPKLIKKAALLHPMMPFIPDQKLELNKHSVLVTYGESDPMVTVQQSENVVATLKNLGATVAVTSHPGGHELTRAEVTALTSFL